MDRGEFPHLTDSQFESVRKMVGIFGGDALRSLAAATPVEQVKRIEAFDMYERGLIAHIQGLQAPVAEIKPAQPKTLRLKANPYEGKEGENLHFWIREVELAMDAALISTERLRGVFALSNQGGRANTWAYTREATMPAAFLPANYEYCQRSRFLACKQGKRELHECIQAMRYLPHLWLGTPYLNTSSVHGWPEGGLIPHTVVPRAANTMEEAIQIALQEEYIHRQARTPTSVWQGHNASSDAVQGAPAAGASTGPVPMELGTAVQSSIRCYGCGKPRHMQRPRGAVAEAATQEPGELGSPVGAGRHTGDIPRPFVIYTDHASLRTATNSPHLSQRMARWLSFFAEYNFRVEYKPGKLNVLADALSRRPDYELAHISRITTDLYDWIRLAYQEDENYIPLVQFLSDGKDAKVDMLSPRQRAHLSCPAAKTVPSRPWRSFLGCRSK
ncbi:LOW QUALITY PROTEIN: Gag protein [Phytophthora palmivora]|uniref:Gag protein n=1 Tax=Phytophthora palmivora TaxID=4796 RepID=A0A2P4YF80_9STRA|nr:LOW QUALITY PROTEIN: Gag protein [Phytophthora palmivora]